MNPSEHDHEGAWAEIANAVSWSLGFVGEPCPCGQPFVSYAKPCPRCGEVLPWPCGNHLFPRAWDRAE